MKYLPDETVLFESDSKKLVLTTHRVRYESKTLGKKHITSLMLEDLVSCQVIYHSYPSFIGVGAVFSLAGFYLVNYVDFSWVIGLTLLALSLLAYLATIKRTVVLSSCDAVINVPLRVLREHDAIIFIDEVEAAKNARYLSTKGVRQQENYSQSEKFNTKREPTLTSISISNFKDAE